MVRRTGPMSEKGLSRAGRVFRTGSNSGRLAHRPSWWLLLLAVVALLLMWQPLLGKMAAEREPVSSQERLQVGSGAGGELEVRAHLAGAQRVWVVTAGDTLWSIARQVAPDQDPRRTIEVLRQANGLRSAALRLGQHLTIPEGLGNR